MYLRAAGQIGQGKPVTAEEGKLRKEISQSCRGVRVLKRLTRGTRAERLTELALLPGKIHEIFAKKRQFEASLPSLVDQVVAAMKAAGGIPPRMSEYDLRQTVRAGLQARFKQLVVYPVFDPSYALADEATELKRAKCALATARLEDFLARKGLFGRPGPLPAGVERRL